MDIWICRIADIGFSVSDAMVRVGGWVVRCSLVTALVTPFLLAGCGDGGTCGKVLPCGGDLTGSWRFVSSCANDKAVNMQLDQWICSDAMLHYESIKVVGTAVYNADLSSSIEGTRSFTVRETTPLGCFTGPNDPTTCAELEEQTAAAMGVLSVSCAGSDVCTCRVDVSYTVRVSPGPIRRRERLSSTPPMEQLPRSNTASRKPASPDRLVHDDVHGRDGSRDHRYGYRASAKVSVGEHRERRPEDPSSS